MTHFHVMVATFNQNTFISHYFTCSNIQNSEQSCFSKPSFEWAKLTRRMPSWSFLQQYVGIHSGMFAEFSFLNVPYLIAWFSETVPWWGRIQCGKGEGGRGGGGGNPARLLPWLPPCLP